MSLVRGCYRGKTGKISEFMGELEMRMDEASMTSQAGLRSCMTKRGSPSSSYCRSKEVVLVGLFSGSPGVVENI